MLAVTIRCLCVNGDGTLCWTSPVYLAVMNCTVAGAVGPLRRWVIAYVIPAHKLSLCWLAHGQYYAGFFVDFAKHQ